MKTNGRMMPIISAIGFSVLMITGAGCSSNNSSKPGTSQSAGKEALNEANSTEAASLDCPAIDPCGRPHLPTPCNSPCDAGNQTLCYDSLECLHRIKPGAVAGYNSRTDGGPFVYSASRIHEAVDETDCDYRLIMALDSDNITGKWYMNVYSTNLNFPDPLARTLPAMLIKGILRQEADIQDFRFYWLKAPSACPGPEHESILMVVHMNGNTDQYYDLSVPPDYIEIPALKKIVDTLKKRRAEPVLHEVGRASHKIRCSGN
jgi:hypothetical protein